MEGSLAKAASLLNLLLLEWCPEHRSSCLLKARTCGLLSKYFETVSLDGLYSCPSTIPK